MTSIEIFILVMVAVGATIGISYAYRVKQMRQAEADRRAEREADYQAKLAKFHERTRQEDIAREELRKHPNYGNPQFNPLNPDVLMPVYKTGPVSDTAATIAAKKRVSNVPTSQTQYVSGNSMGIQSRGSVTVNRTQYDDSNDLLTAMILQRAMESQNSVVTGTVDWKDDVPTIRETYRAPDPEPERTSYKSSYSSDTSDSSYSSSSSDSSSSWD